MAQSTQIESRLESRMHEFFIDEKFFDCVLVGPQNEYKSHRILLAKYCRWFLTYFKNNPSKPHTIQRVEIPVDPNNSFPDLFNFIYSSSLKISSNNIVPLLKIASFYQCDSLRKVLEVSFPDFLNTTTVLPFAKQFSKFEINELNGLLSKTIAEVLIQVLRPSSSHSSLQFTKRDIFESINPSLLSTVLKEPIYDDILSDDDKLSIIDEYISERTKSLTDINQFLTPADRECLTSIFNWEPSVSQNSGNNDDNSNNNQNESDSGASVSSNDLIHRLARHNCDWLSFSISRKILSSLINSRRSSLRSFLTEITNSSSQSFSRWYPFSWLSGIRESLPITSSPQVSLVRLISSLGGETKLFNPQAYGLLTTFSSVEPISPDYDSRNILDDSPSYFLGNGRSVSAAVGINLGPSSYFCPEKIILDSKLEKNTGNFHFIRVPPMKMLFRAGEREVAVFEGPGKEIEMENGYADIELNDNKNGYQMFGVMMNGTSKNGGNVLRLRQFDLKGKFLPDHI